MGDHVNVVPGFAARPPSLLAGTLKNPCTISLFAKSMVLGVVGGLMGLLIVNNYSPKWRCLKVVDIYQATKRQSKYPPLANDTEVNSCFSIFST